jgi:hypothetical protein
VRHALALPLVASAEASSPEPDVALPQGKGTGGTTAAEPLRGEGGATGDGDAGGMCVPLLTPLNALCTVSPCVGSLRVEEGANGRVTVPCYPDQVPRGVNNLREVLPAICYLASFPPMSGAQAYKPWEARL